MHNTTVPSARTQARYPEEVIEGLPESQEGALHTLFLPNDEPFFKWLRPVPYIDGERNGPLRGTELLVGKPDELIIRHARTNRVGISALLIFRRDLPAPIMTRVGVGGTGAHAA